MEERLDEAPEHRRFIIIGHPRTGTGFAASLLKQQGLDIGHEKDGADGVSSWMFTVDDPKNPFYLSPIAESRSNLTWDHAIHPVRNPLHAAPSIILENVYSPISFEFRRRHIMAAMDFDISEGRDDLERAMLGLCYWSELADRMAPALTFQIEKPVAPVTSFLEQIGFDMAGATFDLTPVNVRKKYKKTHQIRPEISVEDLKAMSSFSLRKLADYCEKYGYGEIWA